MTRNIRQLSGNMLISARAGAVQTRAAAHNGRPRSSTSHRTKVWRTPPCAFRDGDMRMPKQHWKSPKGCRERAVAASKNDAGLRGRPEQHLEVDRMLLTCARGWGNGHGCTLGTHADELDVLGEARDAYLGRWCSCMAGACISFARTLTQVVPVAVAQL
jgi:hypothetical protein